MMHDRRLEPLLDAWFADGPTMVPDRVIDDVAARITRLPQRPAWRLQPWRFPAMTTPMRVIALTGALLAAMLGGALLMSGGGGGPAPTPTPSPSPSPSPSPRPAGMSVQGDAASWTAVIPAGWNRAGSRIDASQGYGGPTGVSVGSSGAVNVPSDPCDGVGKVSDATSPADVVSELEARGDLVVSDPIDTTLGGYAGLRVDVAFPADLSACPDMYILFAEPDGSGIPALGPSNRFRIWILDVDGRPVVFWIESFPGTPADDLTEAQQIVDSIVITN